MTKQRNDAYTSDLLLEALRRDGYVADVSALVSFLIRRRFLRNFRKPHPVMRAAIIDEATIEALKERGLLGRHATDVILLRLLQRVLDDRPVYIDDGSPVLVGPKAFHELIDEATRWFSPKPLSREEVVAMVAAALGSPARLKLPDDHALDDLAGHLTWLRDFVPHATANKRKRDQDRRHFVKASEAARNLQEVLPFVRQAIADGRSATFAPVGDERDRVLGALDMVAKALPTAVPYLAPAPEHWKEWHPVAGAAARGLRDAMASTNGRQLGTAETSPLVSFVHAVVNRLRPAGYPEINKGAVRKFLQRTRPNEDKAK